MPPYCSPSPRWTGPSPRLRPPSSWCSTSRSPWPAQRCGSSGRTGGRSRSARPSSPAGAVVTAPIKARLQPGVYTVRWQVTARDGDAMTGEYRFAVGSTTGLALTGGQAATRGLGTTAPLRWLLFSRAGRRARRAGRRPPRPAQSPTGLPRTTAQALAAGRNAHRAGCRARPGRTHHRRRSPGPRPDATGPGQARGELARQTRPDRDRSARRRAPAPDRPARLGQHRARRRPPRRGAACPPPRQRPPGSACRSPPSTSRQPPSGPVPCCT